MPPTSKQRGPANFTQQDGITLREYMEFKFSEADKALELAKQVNEVHFATLNKFKEAMRDQAETFATKSEMDLKFERWISEYKTAHVQVVKDIDNLQEFKTIIETKANQSAVVWAFVVAGIGVLISLWDFISQIK